MCEKCKASALLGFVRFNPELNRPRLELHAADGRKVEIELDSASVAMRIAAYVNEVAGEVLSPEEFKARVSALEARGEMVVLSDEAGQVSAERPPSSPLN